MDLDNEIYEVYDQHQREKSTGSGLVLAVPAIILDTKVDNSEAVDDGGKPVVVTDVGEYENLVTDNQYYEQVEFGNHAKNKVVVQPSYEDSLYSIPQAISSSNSTTGLTSKTSKVRDNRGLVVVPESLLWAGVFWWTGIILFW